MSNIEQRPFVPSKKVESDYPLIDSDPHFKRVIAYARPSDYAVGLVTAAAGPALMLLWEKFAPSKVGRGGFAPIMRLTGAVGLAAGFLTYYQRSTLRFYGWTENSREIELDMKEMVSKVRKGEPLYGVSTTSPYIQGVASRNSRYAGVWYHVLPWFNFVNHNQHGVDTAKYYQQAEKEMEMEKDKKADF
ncbi:NADH-ubiquinone oxidoreductase 20.9 kDa subunit [Golovinomyces cichoracearum]|uniref:NADH-ubiquinone oxidoreductase 20.9 kDa subunit n=1 Tax=Golovinomyces cichoracearum TaxID=62708 RepID=A0A420HHQ6_9PEZI|nr:NADH-ubiquinone oxidoreductase 20.9 kDa subunit [Golovinomyces cichoracearum]